MRYKVFKFYLRHNPEMDLFDVRIRARNPKLIIQMENQLLRLRMKFNDVRDIGEPDGFWFSS